MKSIGTANLKAHLSEHLRAVCNGEVLTVLDRQTPIARIVPLHADEGELVVRPARGSLRELPIPPLKEGHDVLTDLLLERGERL